MLRQVRGALKGVMAWFIIALLILAFALWGVPELRSFTQRAPLRVGKASYSAQTIQAEFNRQMTQRRNQSEGGYTREDALADGLPDYVVNSLANRAVLQQEAAKMGLVMPRSLVREYLQEEEAFKNPATGNFDRLTLEGILQQNNLSVRQFEDLLKDDMLRTQLINAVAAGSTAPTEFAKGLLMRQFEQRLIGYLTITDDMAGVPAEPTPDDLKTYYEENASAFMAPEFRTFTGVTLAYEDFREGLEAPEDELRKLYDARRAAVYEKPERRTVYQLVYETEGEAQAAAAALQQGTPFEQLAEQKGMSLASATLTEAQKRDVVDPQVGDAMFAEGLEEGAVIGPVKGLFGWTVGQIAGITPPETQEFEDVRADLEREFLEQDTRRRVFDIIDELEEARDTGASLEAAAQQAGVEPKKYGPVDSFSFAPGGAIVPDIPGEMLSEAFTLDEGDESMAQELAEGGYFLVQVDTVTPPQLLPYEEVEDEVEQRWRAEERRARIADAAGQVVAAIKEGKSFAEAAEPFNRAVLSDVIGRNADNDALSAGLVERIFTADKGAVVVGDAGSGGAQTVVEIRDIGYNRAAIGPGEETGFRQFVNYQLNQEYLEAYVNALRADYGVKVDNNAVAQIFSDTP